MRQASVEAGVAAGLTLAFVMGAVHSSDFPRSSAYMPTAVCAFAALLSLIWLGQSLLALYKEGPRLLPDPVELRRLAVIVGGGFLMALLIGWLGFFTTFLIMLPALAWFLGYRRSLPIVVGTVLFTVMVYLVFVQLLERPLPPEIWQELAG